MIRTNMLAVEEAHAARNIGVTLDELDSYLDGIINEVEEHGVATPPAPPTLSPHTAETK